AGAGRVRPPAAQRGRGAPRRRPLRGQPPARAAARRRPDHPTLRPRGRSGRDRRDHRGRPHPGGRPDARVRRAPGQPPRALGRRPHRRRGQPPRRTHRGGEPSLQLGYRRSCTFRKAHRMTNTPTASKGLSHKEIMEVMTGLLAMLFVAMLSATVGSTDRKSVVGDLDGNQTQYTWVVTATLLAMTVSSPIWSKLADLFDKKMLVQ